MHDTASLQYLRARYYNTRLAQFISEDSYTGTDDNPLSQNRYIFAADNPFKYRDPSGHYIISQLGEKRYIAGTAASKVSSSKATTSNQAGSTSSSGSSGTNTSTMTEEQLYSAIDNLNIGPSGTNLAFRELFIEKAKADYEAKQKAINDAIPNGARAVQAIFRETITQEAYAAYVAKMKQQAEEAARNVTVYDVIAGAVEQGVNTVKAIIRDPAKALYSMTIGFWTEQVPEAISGIYSSTRDFLKETVSDVYHAARSIYNDFSNNGLSFNTLSRSINTIGTTIKGINHNFLETLDANLGNLATLALAVSVVSLGVGGVASFLIGNGTSLVAGGVMSATGMIARTSGVLLAGIGEIQVTTGLKGYALSGEMLGYSDRVNRTLSGAHNTTAGFRIANRGLRLNQKGNMMIRDAITQQNILKGGTGVVKTPYGDAVQSLSKEAKTVKTSIENGGTVYRGGTLGRSNASEGQYWAPENPLNLGHADRYGVDFGKLILLLVVKSNRIQILSQDQHLV